ncbi:TOMM system kinase/cyclase fusion protein [Vibrio sp. ZSDZ65]|uniref:TOMM system kinase/cyclase fusion protein n=1 Tax=Vibrio qingdaonensis TaxID=2829491 RepID=A0A9X3CL81_9VIBR|nr:TOMM system kinase/cyclase fusion protein [Vibrio qingdaonensis]MCW8345438.1 TOMM system kinase/cyclase fusion protein [Vibrio qingdaonensis]
MGNLQRTKSSVETCFHSTEYQLVEKIGEGGFGQVYKAQQHSTGKYVAIKFLILSDDFSVSKKDRYISRFHRESELISRLNHPNIVTLIDKGQQGDYLIYAVYEYIEGETLQQHLQTHGALNACLAAEIMSCVLDALAHAHQKGVIHRDIKPANIMLYQVGAKTHVKVLDFGIGTLKNEARQLDYKSITLTQETLGTPTYSAPEQLRGEPPLPQTDIYVWGLVFLECLTGVPTFTGTSLASIFHQQLSQANVPLGVLAGHSSANFFRRVLNKRPLQRPSDTAKLYHEFNQLTFSNLVGVLERSPLCVNDSNESSLPFSCHDETVITDGKISFSHLSERKQIAVLALIISSDSVADSYAPRIAQDVVDMLHRDQMQQCIDIAVRYGACHIGSLGDTLLFYFGYPQVTDNDSRLCSRAALEIASNVANKNALLKWQHSIVSQVKMGIDIGLIAALPNCVPEGRIANRAMELSRQAQNGQIVCTENVHAILDSYVEFDGLVLNEQSRRVSDQDTNTCYLLCGERQSEAFGFLRGSRKHRSFVGRDCELMQLSQIVAYQSEESHSASPLIHIHGEAGIGKSRLVIEFRDSLQNRRHLVGQCLPEHKNNALYPILSMLKHKLSLLGLTELQSTLRLKQAVDQTPLNGVQGKQGLIVLSAWLGLPISDSDSLTELSPELQKTRLFEVISCLFCSSETRNQKMVEQYLFVFEDLHWSDPTSREFIQHFVQSEGFVQQRHLWLTTSRNSLPKSLVNIPKTLVQLDKLSVHQSRVFINDLFDKQPLSETLLTLLVERGDGVPLFIEELIASLQKQRLVHKVNGVIDFVNSDMKSQVPVTLRALLQQRLDSLSFSKDTAQLAACIGRDFDYRLLVKASDKDEAQVQLDLKELVDADLVILQRKMNGNSYIFKHALVMDAAYESTHKDRRKAAHLSVAEALEVSMGADIRLMANHYELAGRTEKSLALWKLFGDQNKKVGLHDTAIIGYEKSLSLIEGIEQTASLAEIEIDTRSAISISYSATLGYAHESITPQIVRAMALCREYSITVINEKAEQLFLIQWSSAMMLVVKARHREALKEIEALYEIAQSSRLEHLFIAAAQLKGAVEFAQGRFLTSVKTQDEVIDLFCYEKHHEKLSIYSFDPGVSLYIIQAINYWFLGDEKQCERCLNTAIKLCEQSDLPTDKTHVYNYCAFLFVFKKDIDNAKKYAKICFDLAVEYNHEVWIAHSEVMLGWVECKVGNNCDGVELIRSGYEKYVNTGGVGHTSFLLTLLSEGVYLSGNLTEAIEILKRSITLAEEHDDKFYLAGSYLLMSEYQNGNKQKSEYFNRSHHCALNQEATGFIDNMLLNKSLVVR